MLSCLVDHRHRAEEYLVAASEKVGIKRHQLVFIGRGRNAVVLCRLKADENVVFLFFAFLAPFLAFLRNKLRHLLVALAYLLVFGKLDSPLEVRILSEVLVGGFVAGGNLLARDVLLIFYAVTCANKTPIAVTMVGVMLYKVTEVCLRIVKPRGRQPQMRFRRIQP